MTSKINHTMEVYTMKVKPFFSITVLSMFLSALSPIPTHATAIPVKSVQKETDGVLLKMNPGVLRLQVFSPSIVRVVYGLGPSLLKSKSLAVIGKPGRVRWKLVESTDEVRLLTDELQVHVNRATGEVGFYDKAGRSVLVEETGGGKSLTPNEVGKLKTLKSRQAFVLEPSEAIYGLGQHQRGIMNNRG